VRPNFNGEITILIDAIEFKYEVQYVDIVIREKYKVVLLGHYLAFSSNCEMRVRRVQNISLSTVAQGTKRHRPTIIGFRNRRRETDWFRISMQFLDVLCCAVLCMPNNCVLFLQPTFLVSLSLCLVIPQVRFGVV
jgi:hypothetical protein